MTTSLYILPIVTQNNGRAPKYLPARLNPGGTLPGLEGMTWALQDFVLQPLCVCEVVGSDPQHALLASQSDVILVPPLDNTLGAGAVTTVKNFLEAANFPAGWVQIGQTYRFVLRTIMHVFFYWNNVTGMLGATLESTGATIDSTYDTLPQAWQDRIVLSAQLLGLSTAGLNSSTTVRTIMKNVAQQLDAQPAIVGSTSV